MSAWWEVPGPEGDVAVLDDALHALTALARETTAVHTDLEAAGRDVLGSWKGQAGTAFAGTQTRILTAVAAVGSTQERATSVLSRYAEEWRTAQRGSEQARDELASACDRYVARAREGVGDLVHHLGQALDNPVTDLLGHVVPGVDDLRDRLLSWEPPRIDPVVVARTEKEVVSVSVDRVLGGIGDAWDWGVSHLLDGFHHVLDAIGGAAKAVLDALRSLEEWFRDAVGRVLRGVRSALETLWEWGRRAASALKDLAVDLALFAGRLGLDALQAAIQGFLAAWRGLTGLLGFLGDLLGVLTGLALILSRLDDPGVLLRLGERRIDDPATADEEATLRFLADAAYARHVQQLADLAASSYHYDGAPDGWVRAQNIPGPEGFYAVVYVNERTGEHVLTYRGSQPPGGDFDSADWAQDLLNAGDLPTAQGLWAVKVAQQFRHDHPGTNVSITGHSLGGSLAASASVTTGIPATTFNSAGIGAGNYGLAHAAGGGRKDPESQITNFHTTNDILTGLQEHGPVYAAAGAQVTIASTTGNPGKAHGMDGFAWKKGPAHVH